MVKLFYSLFSHLLFQTLPSSSEGLQEAESVYGLPGIQRDLTANVQSAIPVLQAAEHVGTHDALWHSGVTQAAGGTGVFGQTNHLRLILHAAA